MTETEEKCWSRTLRGFNGGEDVKTSSWLILSNDNFSFDTNTLARTLMKSAGSKRSYSAAMDSTEATEKQPGFRSMFEGFRTELDEHHDRRERVVKTSRDITAASKKALVHKAE